MLRELRFSDLYLEPDGAWYKRSAADRERRMLDGDAAGGMFELRRQLQAHRTRLDFRTEWESVGLRVQRLDTLDGDVYVCRRLREKPIVFEQIGYPPELVKALLADRFTRGGLILWTGATGEGKSMSQASWLIGRLVRFGGTACTVENPVEIRLQGRHGSGVTVGTCYQTEIHSDEEYGPAIERLMRAAPTMIMLGEIRTRAAAVQAVLAGTSGHLVSATLHANDVTTALERLKNMVRESGLDVNLLADSLCAVIHQSMRVTEFQGVERHLVTAAPLIVSDSVNETAIRTNLRKGDFSQLSSELERQRALVATTLSDGRRL
ncbi:ATPase, T2SS/T4P/T4SS family [Paraburkholderia tropica]|uniref:ATPase, T2SS/T4P/T4SS family n=1 Tax=Paraburkholderia tropica TaxID=92647 RepID=UPI002AB6C74C|nr:ATPase, T2SS/T4P/T4SS family [Paraburkholderia tropica]